MGTSYQKGWVSLRGKKWYGYFLRTILDPETNQPKTVSSPVALGLKSEMTKSQAREKLAQEIINRGTQRAGFLAAILILACSGSFIARNLPQRIESSVCYICAMVFRKLALLAVLMAIPSVSAPLSGQASKHSGDTQQAKQPSTSSATASQETGSPASKTDCNGVPCDEQQQPHVIVTLPAPAPVIWSLHDRILWGAYLVLAVLGYVGVMLGLSLLRKIERHTRAAEEIATAAHQSASAALLNSQAIINSERPWLLITAETSPNIENSFNIMATNRGRTPATIIATSEEIKIAIDETHLPKSPEFRNKQPGAPLVPIILLPGESTAIMPFRRDDLKGVCESEERFRKVVSWEEKVFIYGKVIYRDLIAPPDNQSHETAWCCWYIHGRQKSGLVIAGPPSYNSHT